MKLYGFANFVEQQLVPYEYAIVLVWLLYKPLCGYYSRGFYGMTGIDKLRYVFQTCKYIKLHAQ